MSFDLKIFSRDLVIGNDGDLAQVVDSEKLTQDILKICLTPLNANKFNPYYGSPVNQSLIGSSLDTTFLTTIGIGQLNGSLQILQKLQQQQAATNQLVSGAETLAAIQNIDIQRNQVDPRFFSVLISVVSRALTPVSTAFSLRPGL